MTEEEAQAVARDYLVNAPPVKHLGARTTVPVLDDEDRHLVHEVTFRPARDGGLEVARMRQLRLPTWQEQVAATYAMMDR